jgi:hypothetical protein
MFVPAGLSVSVVASVLLAGALVGCGPHLPGPKTSAHRDDEFAEVPYPPPAIKADEVPPRPSSESVWLDGEWRWQGRRWTWTRGGWLTPPADSTFARWDTRRKGTKLLYAPGTFHLADGTAVAADTLRPGAARTRPEVRCLPAVSGSTGMGAPVSSASAAAERLPSPATDPHDPDEAGETAALDPPPRCSPVSP